jgi:hypothetical protein
MGNTTFDIEFGDLFLSVPINVLPDHACLFFIGRVSDATKAI